ncbi:alanine racemase [Nocardioides panaciterrulae]|uniref:D-serine deaminase-like pyridoxal phosphate-dependent protein n=1 Tax=Nocardioides panaciterrulae TaxID=661492 RepID=A0A7Y9E6D2_9ACTN|nr:alanine racemase [Nocardioides panaciterrulae]NYD41924.1 D-serine deaminase-like pyridoxal phosphate-dependent protein [Nocardioides panaciterrulae]
MPATPYLRVDLARLRGNIRAAADLAANGGVGLRPHVKTHKCVEIARLQLAAGAVGISTATLGEAETFVRHGFDDVFIAYPLWLDTTSAGRLTDLTGDARVAIGVDSVEGAANAGRLLGGSAVELLVEVDCGHHRTGVPPEEVVAVATAAARTGLSVRGVFTFPGHSYARGAPAEAARDEAAALSRAAEELTAAGLPPRVVSGGSTPSLAHSDLGVLTELRPGVYVFGDAQQWELGVMPPSAVALTCRTSVVSHAGGRVVLDAGSKVLGADRAAYATGYGRLPEHPEARIVMLSEHHAVVDLAGAALPPLGSRLDVVPNHVCNAVNLVDTLFAEESGELRAWPVAARGLNA